MDFKDSEKERLEREYKEQLDERVKIVVKDLDEEYTPTLPQQTDKRNIVVTGIGRTEEEQKSYYPEYFKKYGVVKPTYHLPVDNLVCAIDLRLEHFTEQDIKDIVSYLVTKWKSVFGLKCLYHNVTGPHLHIQVGPQNKNISETQISNYFITKIMPNTPEELQKALQGSWRPIKTKDLQIIAANVAVEVQKKAGLTVDKKTKEAIVIAAVGMLVSLVSKIPYLKYIPKFIVEFIIKLIVGKVVDDIITDSV